VITERSFIIERLAGSQDLEGVLAVDAASFTRPWTRAMYESEFLNREMSRLHVLRTPGASVVAYIATWIVADEVHVNNLAVLPDYRGRGYGTALLAHALDEAAAHGAHRATLEVRRSNDPARRLYERFGFRVAGLRRDYYSHPTEDALILWREGPGPQGILEDNRRP
jgi:[ribosomal protein S18]-alanine N-acetyltransferase